MFNNNACFFLQSFAFASVPSCFFEGFGFWTSRLLLLFASVHFELLLFVGDLVSVEL